MRRTVTFKDYKNYQPDYTPQEMFNLGIFAGRYFRPIYSSVNKKNYSDQYKEFSFLKNIDVNKMANPKADVKINKYKTNASLSLKYWEDHGWIKPQDPYGHLQWYCRFYSGRRTKDDERQIARANNVLIRFGQRKNKSDRVKQTLLHWGWDADKDHTSYINFLRSSN